MSSERGGWSVVLSWLAAAAEFSFGARSAQDVDLQPPRLLRSFVGRQAARRMVELAGAEGVAPEALGLKGCCRARTCQAAIRTLRATAALAGLALPWRRLMST